MAAIKTADLTAKFATVLGCNAKFIQTRLIALGHEAVCSRCGGCGQYSYCQMYGTTCFGCGGAGKVATKLTAKLLAVVTEEVAAGKLQPYLDELKARAAAKAKVNGASDRFFAAWGENPSVKACAGLHFTKQTARCGSINAFLAPLSDEVSTLERAVLQGEWSKERRGYVRLTPAAEAAALTRIEELLDLARRAEELAPDVVWSKAANRFVPLPHTAR